MTTADPSVLGVGAGQERRSTDQAGCLSLGWPVVVHGGESHRDVAVKFQLFAFKPLKMTR